MDTGIEHRKNIIVDSGPIWDVPVGMKKLLIDAVIDCLKKLQRFWYT